jgi:hypothetical protein
MTKLIKVAFKVDMIKVNEDGKEKWYYVEKNVKGFIQANFKQAIVGSDGKTVLEEGEGIEITKESRNFEGKNVEFAIRVNKPGQAASQPSAPAQSSAPVQAPSAPKQAYGEKSPDVQRLIVKQSTMASACQAVQVMTGQINDVTVLEANVLRLYATMLNKINEA